jgi:hypothetical protein
MSGLKGLALFVLGVGILWFGIQQTQTISSIFDQVCPIKEFGGSQCDAGRPAVQLLQILILIAAFAVPAMVGLFYRHLANTATINDHEVRLTNIAWARMEEQGETGKLAPSTQAIYDAERAKRNASKST